MRLSPLMWVCYVVGLIHLLSEHPGTAHAYIAAGLVVFGLIILKDDLKEDLT